MKTILSAAAAACAAWRAAPMGLVPVVVDHDDDGAEGLAWPRARLNELQGDWWVVTSAWRAIHAEAARRVAEGEDPELMVHCIGDSPASGLSSGITRAELARGGYMSRYYRLGDLAGV
jgi:hypothetical protein